MSFKRDKLLKAAVVVVVFSPALLFSLCVQVWGGNPAVYLRDVTPEEKAQLTKSAEGYVVLAGTHSAEIPA